MSDDCAIDDEWDAGEMGCGELVLELRLRMDRLSAGGVLKLIGRDAGLPEDLPAWCRMTGHRLRRATPPEYFLEKRFT
ncbi:MAG: sulfurtransferase TusA family protein [Planctomycetales bacterium]